MMSEELEKLALAVQFLRVSHTDPERFHEEKSEIVHKLRELAAKAEGRRERKWFAADRA